MGDTGSLSIGAILGSIALLTNSIFTLTIFSGIFIIESLSVMIQVGFFKITKKLFHKGKRIFLMIRRPPRSTRNESSAASDVYKRQYKE